MLQVKPKYRFRVLANNFGPINPQQQLDLTRQVATVTRPSITQEPVWVDAYNSKMHYLGKHTWNPITLVVRDDITNAVTSLVSYQLQKQLNHYEQTGFAAGVNYKFTLLIQMMDGSNSGILDEWFLEGCSVSEAQYGDLDSAASDPTLITMTIPYDNATLSNGTVEEGLPNSVMPSPVDPSQGGVTLGS